MPNPIANPNSTTTYTLSVTLPGVNCVQTEQVTVHVDEVVISNGTTTNQLLNLLGQTGNPVLTDKYFYLDGTFEVNNDLFLTNCHFYLAEGAKIRVKNGAELGFDHYNTVESCDPTKFWNSIVVKSGSYVYTHSDNYFSGANSVFTIEGDAKFALQHSNYENNKRALTVQTNNGQGSFPSTNGSYSLNNFKGNTVRCTSPVDGVYPIHAVKVIDWYYQYKTAAIERIIIEDNVFEATGGGVYAYQSDVDIDNNEFLYFSNTFNFPGSVDKPEIAIDVRGYQGSNTKNTLATIQNNYFNNCYLSIKIRRNITLKVESNKVNYYVDNLGNESVIPSNINETFFESVGNDENILVDDNTVYNTETGVYIKTNSSATISNNTFEMEYNSTNQNNLYSKAIHVDNSQLFLLPNYSDPNTVHNIKILDNVIKHAKTGILTEFAFAKIKGNTIEDINNNMNPGFSCGGLNPPCPSNPYGIRAKNELVRVLENEVINHYSGGNTDANMVAISIENTETPFVTVHSNFETLMSCNKVENTGIGLRFVGAHNNNADATYNTMKDHTRGFVLHSNGKIGNVGASGRASDNQWLWTAGTGASHTFANNSNGGACTIYVGPNGGNYDPIIDIFIDFVGTNSSSLNKNSGNTQQPANCNTPLLSVQQDNKGVAALSRKKSNVSRLNIVKNKRSHLVHASDSVWRFEKQLLHRQLNNDTNTSRRALWQTFTDSMRLNSGQIKKEGPFNGYQTNSDQNIARIASILTNYRNGNTLNKKQLDILYAIAQKCPYYDGISVLEARSILYEYGFSLIENDCEKTLNSTAATKRLKSSLFDDEHISLAIYPNPTNGIFNVEFTVKKDELVDLFILDISGRLIHQERLYEGQFHLVDNVSLQQGVYFIRLNNGDGMPLANKKIVVSK